MFSYKTLEAIDDRILHQTFVSAFSDYQIKMDLPPWKLQQMLSRRGYIPEKSMGVFKEETLVGFILNGYREWEGKTTVYDTGTGVVPEYRKQGLTTNMFRKVMELLRVHGVKQYLLEVLQQNTSAYELYRKQGFEITRSFSCFKLDKCNYKYQNSFGVEQVDGFTAAEWEGLKEFWDFQPSWQNSIDSVCVLPEDFIYSVVRCDNKIVGYGIIEKRTGDIPQICVDKNYRHKGFGRSIMAELVKNTEANRAAVINVDDKAEVFKEFLNNFGFENYVQQYEMILEINT